MGTVFRVTNVLLGAKRSADSNILHLVALSNRLSIASACNGTLLNNYLESDKIASGCSWTLVLSRQFHSGVRSYQKTKPKSESTSRELVEGKDTPFSQLTTGQKVKHVGKDATYTGVIIGGLLVTGYMFYAIGRELFSGQSPSGIYSRAFKLCRKNEQVIDAIGEPIKGYGEMTSRGRRRFVKHAEYEIDSIKFMRMQFYLEGPLNKGTVHLEVKQDDRKKYQFYYVLVELNSYPQRTIVIEDNRYSSI